MSPPAEVTINGATFSRYECQLSCAIKLWIKDVDNAPPYDETLGYIIKRLRGDVDNTVLSCKNIVAQIEHHAEENIRSIHFDVRVDRRYWESEATRVYLDSGFIEQSYYSDRRSEPYLYENLVDGV